MALRLVDKKAIVAEVADVATNAVFAVVANYRGLTVAQMTALRSKARATGSYIKVVPNTLARRAVKETSFSCLDEKLVGPVILLFTNKDAGDAARFVRDFAKEHKLFEVQALAFAQQLLPSSALENVANLPTRDEAIAMLMAVLNAPVTKFVRTLAEPYAQCVRAVNAVAQKQAA